MKYLLTILVVGAVVTTSSADLTYFGWKGGVATDANGVAFPHLQATAHTFLNLDPSAFMYDIGSGQLQIDIENLPVAYSINELGVTPIEALGGTYSTYDISGDGSIAGMTAYLVIKDGSGPIQFGDHIGFGGSGLILERDTGEGPPLFRQDFSGGNVQTNTFVVPEPSTIGLMGIASIGVILFRRKMFR